MTGARIVPDDEYEMLMVVLRANGMGTTADRLLAVSLPVSVGYPTSPPEVTNGAEQVAANVAHRARLAALPSRRADAAELHNGDPVSAALSIDHEVPPGCRWYTPDEAGVCANCGRTAHR